MSTHWTVVLDAARASSPDHEQALAILCTQYWYPVYAFLRGQGYAAADAQDLAQGFFARLLEKGDLAQVDRAKGRFRSFLLVAVKHYMLNEWDKTRALKRGGGKRQLSVSFVDAESRYAMEPSHTETAEAIYDRQWALATLDEVRRRLVAEQLAAGKQQQFERLQVYLTGADSTPPYREVAVELEMSEVAVKVAVHRLRTRFRELLREQIAQTTADASEVDDEIRTLFAALKK